MFVRVTFVLAAMAIAYAVAKRFRASVELSMLAAAIVGALAGGAGIPFRHILEGSITYLDICLIFVTATIFMNIVKEAGGLDYLVRAIVTKFHRQRALTLVLLMLLMLVPGALTGAGSVSILVSGGTVALVLNYMGIAREKVAAMVFILAGLSAAAPPVNIWAMMTCAGTAIPYVGFELPLAIPVLFLGLLTVFSLGLRGKATNIQTVLRELPVPPAGMTAWRVAIPFIIVFGLIAAPRIWPFAFPLLGLPLVFVISGAAAFLLSPRRLDLAAITRTTLQQLLPLLGTCVVVGVLLQIMTLTGVRGLLSLAVISLPIVLIYILLPITIPLSEGVLTVGGAAVLGIPLIWTFNSIGLHPTVALSGLSLLWFLGDGLPPTALIGRLCIQTVGYTGSYWKFLKACWLPWVATTIVGTLMVVFSKSLSFLVR